MAADHFEEIYSELCPRLGSNISREEPLKSHTTFGIGGPTALLITLEDLDQLLLVLETLKNYDCPSFVLGGGSNLLVSDRGFRGVVLKLSGRFSFVEKEGLRLRAGAGANVGGVIKAAQRWGLNGLAYLVGIPGTLGGALAGNAGAFGYSIGERLVSARVCDATGGTRTVRREDLGFGYRNTMLDRGSIILEALFDLEKGDPDQIKREMDLFLARRLSSQPPVSGTAGCVFKNPEGKYAGELIERAGCKGMRVGGAMVSDIHANFIVNRRGAIAQDVMQLIEMVRERVRQKEGIILETEIVLLGEFT